MTASLTVDQERLVLAARAAECDYCGGVGRVQRTQRRKRRLRSGKVVWQTQAVIRYPRCSRCRDLRRLLDKLAEAA